jgi:hypothetical protein
VGAAACRDAPATGCGGGDAIGRWRIAAVDRDAAAGLRRGAAARLLALRSAGMIRWSSVVDCRRPPGCCGEAVEGL